MKMRVTAGSKIRILSKFLCYSTLEMHHSPHSRWIRLWQMLHHYETSSPRTRLRYENIMIRTTRRRI